MDFFLKSNKTLLTYTLLTLFIISTLGIKFFISFLGNILLLLFLIPLLLLLLVYIGFNSYKLSFHTCNSCGSISLGLNDTCMNCGEEIKNMSRKNQLYKQPSESTIEVQAEEIK